MRSLVLAKTISREREPPPLYVGGLKTDQFPTENSIKRQVSALPAMGCSSVPLSFDLLLLLTKPWHASAAQIKIQFMMAVAWNACLIKITLARVPPSSDKNLYRAPRCSLDEFNVGWHTIRICPAASLFRTLGQLNKWYLLLILREIKMKSTWEWIIIRELCIVKKGIQGIRIDLNYNMLTEGAINKLIGITKI